jgi:circadian clock protein KaiB
MPQCKRPVRSSSALREAAGPRIPILKPARKPPKFWSSVCLDRVEVGEAKPSKTVEQLRLVSRIENFRPCSARILFLSLANRASLSQFSRCGCGPSIATVLRQMAQRRNRPHGRYVLKLYVAGATSRSQTAITTVASVCGEHSSGSIDLEILDIYQAPLRAGEAGILATPTLVRELPLPASRLVGDLAERKLVRRLLGLKAKRGPHG